MGTCISTQPQDWREGRRFRAWELKQQGWKQQDIAKALGVSPGAVSQWLKAAREGGTEALRRHPAPGPQPRLTPEQKAEIPGLLAKGAEAYGFRGDLWTTARIAAVIKEVFGVSYHPAHICRLLKAIGWSVQKPVRRCRRTPARQSRLIGRSLLKASLVTFGGASQRDEAAIADWYAERWPALKRGRKKREGP